MMPSQTRSRSGNGRPTHALVDSQPSMADVTMVHCVAGRVRVRIVELQADSALGERLSQLLREESYVTGARVARACGSLSVGYDTSETPAAVVQKITDLLVRARVEQMTSAVSVHGTGTSLTITNRRRGRFALLLGFLGASALRRFIGFAIPGPLAVIAVGFAAAPILRRAVKSVATEKRLNIDVLDAIAIVLTTLRGSFFTPAVMIATVEIGEAIRDRTQRSSQREAFDLLSALSPVVWIERGGERVQVPIETLTAGEIVVVYPGDRIPVDGRIIEGTAQMDEHQLTGESLPAERSEGEVVYASTLVREGHLHINVERVGDETRAARILHLMKDAPVHDTRIEDFAARIADRAVLPALLLAALVLIVTRDPTRAASILITDFTTGVRVSVPTTVLAALSRAAKRGVLIRNGRTLEKLAHVDAVVFDKTGTITTGTPTITSVVCAPGIDEVELVRLAASADQRLTHPVAEAVMRYADDRGIRPVGRGTWTYQIGLGVRADVDGREVLVGSDRLMEREGVDLAEFHANNSHLTKTASLIYVVCDGVLYGALPYTDPVRPESAEVIARLVREYGTEIHMLTGDTEERATTVANELGIDRSAAHARLFPEHKAELVQRLRGEGKTVAFVGDGINDLPALAYADVSVSFGGASDAARETADIVLMDDDLRGLTTALEIGAHGMRLIRQNIAVIGGANLGALTLASTRGLGPVSAAIVHNGSTVVAALNGLRPAVDINKKQQDMARALSEGSSK